MPSSRRRSAAGRVAVVMLGAALAVTLVLLASFHSWADTLAVLLVAAASLAGVLVALHVTGETFNIASFVGAIMMVGIVAENAYFLLVEFRDALDRGATHAAAAQRAMRRRVR